MKKMADQLKKCADCMKPGGNGQKQQGKDGQQQAGGSAEQQAQATGKSLDELAEQIEGMQQQLQDMEDLEDLQDLAEDFKNQMQGGGGGGPENDKRGKGDWAGGSGNGQGKRSLEEDKTGGFKTRAKAKLQRGETVVTGDADGENITGRSVTWG